MVKILYDHQIFSLQKYGGVSRYFVELMRQFNTEDDVDIHLPLLFSENVYLKSIKALKYNGFWGTLNFRRKKNLSYRINKYRNILTQRRKNFDVFHPTYFNPGFLSHIEDKPFVLTVYDMIYEKFPHYFADYEKTSRWKRRLLQKARKVIAISNQTRQDILEYCPVDEKKIEVIYLAGSIRPPQNKPHFSSRLPEKYLLYVGDRRFYKNFTLFIRAAAPLLGEDSSLHVVCAGGGPFTADEAALFENLGIKGKLLQYQVDDNLLGSIYRSATALVFPSLYEGFGMPVVEAFNCGCPVTAGRQGALPEIAADAALYFDPASKNSIMEAVRKIIHDQGLRDKLVKEGENRSRNFSWKETARRTKGVYESCC